MTCLSQNSWILQYIHCCFWQVVGGGESTGDGGQKAPHTAPTTRNPEKLCWELGMGGKAVIVFCRLFFCCCFALGDIIQKIMASLKKKRYSSSFVLNVLVTTKG